MTLKDSLKGFLKKEVKRYKGRLQKSSPAHSLFKSGPALVLPDAEVPRKHSPDSLFSGSVSTNDTDELCTSKPSKVVAVSVKVQPSSRSPKSSPTGNISLLKKELELVLERELQPASKEEKKSLAVQRADLVSKISRMERADRDARVKHIKAPFNLSFKKLPEPVTPEEKKRLMNEASLIEKARLSPIEPLPKRVREEFEEDDDDLDGEERFYQGKKLKRAAIKVTGHWGSEIHNYMPESQINTEEYNMLKSMSTEERKAKRKELTIYLKNAAEADRQTKKEKKIVDDEDSLWV